MFINHILYTHFDLPIPILDEQNLRKLPVRERLDKCVSILQTSKDESLRWDAVWLAGEISETAGQNDPIFDEVSDLMSWILQNDNNGVVKHEACYQIAARDMRNKIPDLIQTVICDRSTVARHEAIESLGLMRAFESKEQITKALKDPSYDVRETATFVLKRFKRLEEFSGTERQYKPSEII